LLASDVVTMYSFVPGLPEDKEITPQSSHGAERPSGPGVYTGMDRKPAHIPVLENAPLCGQMAIREVLPTDCSLFVN
jgi:hypothetical protein